MHVNLFHLRRTLREVRDGRWVGKALLNLPMRASTIQPVQEQPGVASGPLTSSKLRTASVTMYIIGFRRFRL